MISATTCRTFAGGSGTDRIDFGSGAALDNLHNSAGSGFYGMFVIRPNAIVSNSWIAEKGTLPNGWQFLFDRNAANTADGYIRLLVWRDGGVSDTHASNQQLSANTSYVVGFSWHPTTGGKLFVGALTGAVSEVTYGTQSISSGAAVSDAASNLIVGNDAAGSTDNKGFPGEIERFAVGAGTITAADVQRWRDAALPGGALVAAYLGKAGGSSETDITGNGNTGTVTGATIGAARDPVYILEATDFWDSWTPVKYNANTTSEYVDASSFARVRLTCAADTVDVVAYQTYDGTGDGRASMNAITADKDGVYAGQLKTTANNAYSRGTISLGGTATTIDIMPGAHSRRTANTDGTEPQQGTFPVALRLTVGGVAVTPTLVTPATPTAVEIVVSDSLFGDGFTTDPSGQYNHWLQRRRARASSRNVAFSSFGGHSVYIAAADSTRRTATVARLNSIPGTRKGVMIELGANDKGITSWTPTQCATALSSLITDIQSGVTGLEALVIGVPLAQSAGNEASTNAGGYTVQDYRDAILALAPIAGVTFIDTEAWISASNLNADGIHATNAGLDEIYGNMMTPLDAAFAALDPLESAVSASSAVSAALTTSIQMAAGLAASATVTGALTTSTTCAASLSASATATADLTTAIQMAAAASASATATAALTVGSSLEAAISASATVTGALTTSITCAAALSATATTTADLTVGSGMSATVTGTATLTGALTTSITAAAAITARATVTAALTVGDVPTYTSLTIAAVRLSQTGVAALRSGAAGASDVRTAYD